jgi:CO/xanthine dehydrogenase Mo-binding subunit
MSGSVGESVVRSDGRSKVTGQARYAIDVEEARLLHAKLLRSPVASARIVRLDTTRARSFPGVEAIVTAADAPAVSGWIVKDAPLFAAGVVRYAGEPIAAVAAETPAQARAAAAAIELELEPLPASVTLDDAVAAGGALVHPDWESYEVAAPVPGLRKGNVAWETTTHHGDLEAAFAREDVVVVEDEFRVPRQNQAYIEPRATVARYEAGRYVLRTSTQWPYQVRNTVAAYLGVRPADVRVVVETVGGGFGGKVDSYIDAFAALLARATDRPVKLVNTRRDEFVSGNPRENAIVRLRSAVTTEGEIAAREIVYQLDAGAYAGESPFLAAVGVQTLAGTYRIGALRCVAQAVYTNTPPTGAFRGVGGLYCVYAREQHMDRIAAAVGLDRRELRRRNLLRDGDLGPTGQVFTDMAFDEELARIEQTAPWAEVTRRRPNRGVGFACTVWITNAGPGGVALKLNEDGTVGLITAAVDCGSGAMAQGVTQIVAGSLGLRPQDVVLMPPDTDAAPFDMGAAGGRTTVAVGNAALRAAAEVRERIVRTAAALMEVAPEDLELADGTVHVAGAPERAMPLGAVAQAATWTDGPITGHGSYNQDPVPFNAACSVGLLLPAFAQYTCHTHLCEVEIDPDTGKVTVLRYVVAQDVGKAINPEACVGQIQGAVTQGLGYALLEGQRIDDEGRVVEDRFETYRLPTALDAPPIEPILVEGFASPGPHGAKGVAEGPILPSAAAIASAVSDAIGVPMRSLPMTPWAVLEAIRAGDSAGPPGAWSWRDATIAEEPVIAEGAAL